MAWSAELPTTSERQELERMEALADILACIFAEAQGMGRLDSEVTSRMQLHNDQDRVNR